ncbi:MAG TPA: FecR domain-containing protein [Rubricoccaceae bacterium]|jgi:transmembrane sensor
MTDPTARIALAETPADVADVLATAPHLAADAARWRAVRAAIRRDLASDLPDADLLVLRALDSDALDAPERARLAAARPALDAAVARHPGLAAVSDLVAADAQAFSDLFDAALVSPGDMSAVAELNRVAETPRPAPVRASDRPASPASRRASRRWMWRTAALLGVAGFAAVLATVGLRDRGFETITASTARTVTLADGSVADLAAGTVLMVPEAGTDPRQARLREGEALFHIVHDPARPFAVETPNAEVGVLGTVFAVRVAGAGTQAVATRVTLLTGRVNLGVRGAEPAVVLAPGQASTVAALAAPTAPVAADRGEALAFLPDLEFRDTPAGDVADQLGERFGVPMTVDAALAGEALSASFRMADGPEAAARALALALGGRVVAVGGGFRIAG